MSPPALIAPGVALAQPSADAVPRGDAEDDEQRLALQPVGARAGAFLIYPKAEASVVRDSNVYAAPIATPDTVFRLEPSITVIGDLAPATLALRASADRQQYARRRTESRTDWNIGTSAQIEAARGFYIYAAAARSDAHEDRSDPNASNADRTPTAYGLTEASAGISADGARLRFGLDGALRRFDYRDNVLLGGTPVNNDDRDRVAGRVSGRIGFAFSPGYAVVARLSREWVRYRSARDDFGFARDAQGWRATLGVNFELSRLLEGEVWAGYLRRDYRDARFGRVARPLFGAGLTWRATPLTRLRIEADRNVSETVLPDYRGHLSTTAGVTIEHELLRTLTVTLTGRYARDDFLPAQLSNVPRRRDSNFGMDAAARYQLGRNMLVRLAYARQSRDSDAANIGFSRSRLTAGLSLQF